MNWPLSQIALSSCNDELNKIQSIFFTETNPCASEVQSLDQE